MKYNLYKIMFIKIGLIILKTIVSNEDSAEIKRIFVTKENRHEGLAKLIISKFEE